MKARYQIVNRHTLLLNMNPVHISV
uniref:Uncharacterized protein n=1 Tax=Arundo donax TaxID=35708 RepID=A0A0A9ACN6_ARUDO